MALSSAARVFYLNLKKSSSLLASTRICVVQTANLTSKENRDPDYKRPKPWPYETKYYSFLWGYVEGTVKRFDENTKIVVVDGNIGAGKSAFAKQLAEAFDLVYFPEPTMEPFYVTPYGYDIRLLDDIVPPSYKACDLKTFYSNPHHRNVAQFQFRMFMFRYEQYIDALAHVLNTGQGVVMERSVYGDFVFMETMHKFGYISDPVRQLYKDINENTLDELLRPHLIVYLDVSPEVCLQRIKERNDPTEVNSKVLTKEYLETLEHYYKHHYLKKLERHTEILIYDWNNFGDVEVVVEDIERIDFERYSRYDFKLQDWRKADDWEWNYFRRQYTTHKNKLLIYSHIFRPKVSEVHHPPDEVIEYRELLEKIPGEMYEEGFNPNAGDNVWFKTDHKGFRYMPIIRYRKE
ncbi:NADH dehydrogenase [ubiquinone] 1 alpha subcomplex subunit 10, mitochondrial [Parasteatoda tepidariorum]|uniref:NADH dehydrogenase [ubiquinone] 1 alpha subcomplex subunit 10, mitochondrial n=1 Tax=Parasteatoda tepidariorum TaxID=114398 RepID=UPI001C719DE4|nr:NADH dehydrogenase [ubiquinone] 1 alpha subcomplex subunit 10, mitochondrial [Parasteatoda tepidariorum]